MTKEVHLYASQRVSRRAKDGSDGTSVTIISKSVTYQISASGTETPTGNWSDKVVATTDTKPYLWTRTIVVYSDTNSTTSYSVSYKGKDGAPGKDAYRVEASPSTLVFDTNENGVVDVSELSGKYATVTVYKGSQKISTDNLSLPSNYATKKYTNVDGKISNNNGEARITITKIEQETISGDEKVSKSSGQISFPIDVLGERSTLMWVTVNVQVNVAKFTGSIVINNKQYESKFEEISTRFNNTPTNKDLTDAESRITQTAREISLSVSEKTIGRRNLLVGSAFRRQGEISYIVDSHPYFIRMNDGYGGTNCAYMSKSGMTQNVWCGAMWNPVKVKPNTKYTFSMMMKVTSVCDERFDVQFIDVTSNSSNSVAFDTLAAANNTETFGWTLKKITITTPSSCTKLRIDAFVRRNGTAYMCRPMLEEGDYNGWTLSEQDYDYIGGNMLDNARTLDKSGTLSVTNDTVIQNGYGTDSACIKNLMQANAAISDYKEVLMWSFGSTYLVNGNDYIFSFVAKADVDDARVVCYMWSGDINISSDIFTEGNGGAWDSKSDGYIVFILSRQWTRYWVHWRPKDGYATPKEMIIRHTGNNSTSASTVYVTQPKLEIGATMTEWTERKSDLVDKASLKKAGIGITDKEVMLYGEQVKVMTGNVIAALFKNGMLNADLIAAKVLESLGSNGARVTISDGIMEFFGSVNKTKPNIRFGLNSEGSAVLSYYDNDGNFLYDLGPSGISTMDKTNGSFTEYKFYTSQNLFGVSSTPSSYGTYKTFTSSQNSISEIFLVADTKFDSHLFPSYNPSIDTKTTLYRYTAPRINGKIVADPAKGFTTQELASKADGRYFTNTGKANVVVNGELASLAPDGDYWNVKSSVTNQGKFISALLKANETYSKPTYSRGLPMSLASGSPTLGIRDKICSQEKTVQKGLTFEAFW